MKRAQQRSLGTFRSVQVNNFFLFVALLVGSAMESGLPPWSAIPFLVAMALPLVFPLSADPLERIPAERLGLWPLSRARQAALRLMSLALSPVLWIVVAVLLKKGGIGTAFSFAALAAGAHALTRLGPRVPGANILRWVPAFPGRLGVLFTHNLREMAAVLDTWVAASLAAVGIAYRCFTAHPDPAAFPVLAVLVALALSTRAQSLFGFEFEAGVTLYRILPLRGWEILAAKDAAFLAVLVVLILPLDPGAGLTFGLASLAIGHHSSVCMRLPQTRWRFAGGRLLPAGALQGLGSLALAFAEIKRGPVFAVATAAGYVLSLWFYGRRLPEEWEN